MLEAQDVGPQISYEFGPFRLDAHAGVLYRDGHRLALPPKALDLLQRLLSAGGEVVTRGELLHHLWPDVVVEEANITKLVHQVRETLAVVPEFSSAIETAPRRGYRFVAPFRVVTEPVRTTSGTGSRPDPGADAPLPPSFLPRRGRWPLLAAGAVMTLALLSGVVGLLLAPRAAHPEHTLAAPGSIAVLPFKNFGGDPADAYFGEGLAEDIVIQLSKVPGLHVVSRASTARYQGSTASLDSIGAALGVGSVIEGSVRRSGGRIRITVQVTDVSDGHPRWAETYDRNIGDLLDVQADVASKVTMSLGPALGKAGGTPSRGGTSDAQAYDHYLRALSDLDRWGEEDRLASAIRNLRSAVARDDRFASAHAVLARAHVREGYRGGNKSWATDARKEAERALALEPNLALPHVVKGNLLFSWPGHWDAEGAIREFRLAQELEPSTGHLDLADLFAHMGIEKPALRELELALSFDPLSDWTRDRAIAILVELGRWDEALTRVKTWFPEEPLTVRPAWHSAVRRGLAKQLLRELGPPGSHPATNQRMLAEAATGAAPEIIRERIEELKRTADGSSTTWHHLTHQIACAEALTGHPDAAVDWLRRTAEGGFPNYLLFSRDPFLDSLHGHPDYQRLMATLRSRWDRWLSEYP